MSYKLSWNNFKFVRKYKKGVWWKTKHRGWIRPETFGFYIGYKFDPIFIKEEIYEE